MMHKAQASKLFVHFSQIGSIVIQAIEVKIRTIASRMKKKISFLFWRDRADESAFVVSIL